MIRLLYSDRDLPPASLKGMASPELAHQQGYRDVQGCCAAVCCCVLLLSRHGQASCLLHVLALEFSLVSLFIKICCAAWTPRLGIPEWQNSLVMPKYGKKSQGKTDFPSLGHVRVGSHDHWLGGWIILIIKPRPYAHPVARFNCQKGREECRCKIFFFLCPSYWVKFYKSNTQGARRLSVQEDLFIRDLRLFQTFFFHFS